MKGDDMQTYEQLQFQIGAWAVDNFGGNETPYLEVLEAGSIKADKPRKKEDKPDQTARHGNMVVELGSLAPLMGMVEELGELMAAVGEDNKKDMEDALGDIAVYLCDYCCRENMTFPSRPVLLKQDRYEPSIGAAAYLGRLYRCHLKRHQRIRQMHNPKKFEAERAATLRGFVWHIQAFSRQYTQTDLLVCLNETWNNIVKKRDWRADAAQGGGHTHKEERDK